MMNRLENAARQAAEPVGQKPYAYEYGVDNGDGTYSIQIDRGSLIHTGVQYEYCAPRNPHPEHPLKPLYTHPTPPQQPLTDEQRDAARYRWLRENRATLLITGFFGNGCINRAIDEVDKAIDRAIKAAHSITGSKI